MTNIELLKEALQHNIEAAENHQRVSASETFKSKNAEYIEGLKFALILCDRVVKENKVEN